MPVPWSPATSPYAPTRLIAKDTAPRIPIYLSFCLSARPASISPAFLKSYNPPVWVCLHYTWRSRSGCTFCFFQRKIEWVGLLERHPEDFEQAKKYEKTAIESGSPFTWCDDEFLEQLAQPNRIAAIRADHKKRIERIRKKLCPIL